MRKDQLSWGIEEGLSEFDSCLDALKVFYMKLDIILIFLKLIDTDITVFVFLFFFR